MKKILTYSPIPFMSLFYMGYIIIFAQVKIIKRKFTFSWWIKIVRTFIFPILQIISFPVIYKILSNFVIFIIPKIESQIFSNIIMFITLKATDITFGQLMVSNLEKNNLLTKDIKNIN